MKVLYLDQNKWIELARLKKKSSGKDPVYLMLLKQVASKQWCIPISAIHIFETLKRVDKESRADVLSLMCELSKGHSILSFRDIEEAEVINAFADYYDKSKRIEFTPIRSAPFYTMGGFPTLSGCEKLPDHIVKELKTAITLCMTDSELFYGILGTAPLHVSPDDVQADIEIEQQYLTAMAEEREKLLSHPKQLRYKIYLGYNMMAHAFKPYYTTLAQKFGLTGETFFPKDALSTPERTVTFLESIPSLHVRIMLHYDLLVDKSYGFHAHDMFDTLFLATAVPYSDLIVTERTWRHRIKKLKLDRKYSTIVIDKLTDIQSKM